jgi:hypothetical protein
MKEDSRLYQLLAAAALIGPHGPLHRRDPALYAELKGRLMNIINGTPEDILQEYAEYLRALAGLDGRPRRVYREFCDCVGIEAQR